MSSIVPVLRATSNVIVRMPIAKCGWNTTIIRDTTALVSKIVTGL